MKYLFRSKRDLNLIFYEGYDENFLLHKAIALNLFVENRDDFGEIVVDGEPKQVDKKFVESLRGEVYFSQFHQFEALFALLIAIYQDKPHWLYLTTYRNNEIKERVRLFLDDKFEELTGSSVDSLDAFVLLSVFAGYGLLGEREDAWKTNIADIGWMLKRLAKKFMEANEYNAYKHGIRTVVSDHRVGFLENNETEFHPIAVSENAVTFLETKQLKKDVSEVWMTTKHFNPSESFNNLFFMASLVGYIKICRLAQLKKSATIPSDSKLFLFIDKEKVMANEETFRASHTI